MEDEVLSLGLSESCRNLRSHWVTGKCYVIASSFTKAVVVCRVEVVVVWSSSEL